jgi:hypothetical protein
MQEIADRMQTYIYVLQCSLQLYDARLAGMKVSETKQVASHRSRLSFKFSGVSLSPLSKSLGGWAKRTFCPLNVKGEGLDSDRMSRLIGSKCRLLIHSADSSINHSLQSFKASSMVIILFDDDWLFRTFCPFYYQILRAGSTIKL